jgi:hypothetical protein
VPVAATQVANQLDGLANQLDQAITNISNNQPLFAPLLQHLPHGTAAIKNAIAKLLNFQNGQGIADMRPGSPYLTTVRNGLPQADIPILMLGGEIKSFATCIIPVLTPKNYKPLLANLHLHHVDHYLVVVAQTWGNILGNPINDLLIPLDSQQARNINNPKIIRKVWDDYHHYLPIQDYNPAYEEILSTIKKWLEAQ